MTIDKHKTEKGVNSERWKERKSQGKTKTSQRGEEEAPERGKEGRKKYKRETTTVVQFYQFIISYQIQYKIRFK
jgi:hypothetical protein